MIWSEQKFEKQMIKSLTKSFDKTEGDAYYTHYKNIRNKLIEELYPQIPVNEPNLTDHTATHIKNVLTNAFKILDEGKAKNLSGMDWYFLGLAILFHDVGNVYERKEHWKFDTIAKIYDHIIGENPKYSRERYFVSKAAEAHSGKGRDGSADTMKDIDIFGDIDGHQIRLRDMAVVLRFADELAEGPQRTSYFMNKHGLFDDPSKPYHLYASQTSIFIDRNNERIGLTYDIKMRDVNGQLTPEQEKNLSDMLSFIYLRVHKLDQERKYARHHSDYCSAFKRTSVTINIEINGESTLELNNCVLDDVTVPGEDYKELGERFDNYKIPNIISAVRTARTEADAQSI
ncbi:HD domain-containing protein [Dyadobacter sp. OTU695]|uniref:HD domain-containing protein n=1 Tax=Dyadobacter sp. OTU695 TaxID=3043860 RepID=UPI00313CD71A